MCVLFRPNNNLHSVCEYNSTSFPPKMNEHDEQLVDVQLLKKHVLWNVLMYECH